MTNVRQLMDWFQAGAAQGYKRMVVWVDEFNHEDYPAYTNQTGSTLSRSLNKQNGQNMQRVMEVYNLEMDMQPQMGTARAFNY